MKKIVLLLTVACFAASLHAQQDSTNRTIDTAMKSQPDTIRVGNFVIIKKNKNGAPVSDKGKSFTVIIRSHSHQYDTVTNMHQSAFSTNWFVVDLGFANYNDRTNYTEAAGSSYLHLNQGENPFVKSDLKLLTKSSNIDIWLFMQKLNIAKRALNLKYGLGLEMFNFRYDNNISYNKTPAYIFRDSVNFSKDKLYTSYASIPLMLNINPWPNKKVISVSFGASAGYLIGSHTKQKSEARGKNKVRGDFDLDKWRLAYVGELAIGPVRLYGSYSMHPLHNVALKQYPYTIGVRISSW